MALQVSDKIRVCWGVKARGNKRLKCGNETDETTRKEALKLINVFLNRVEKHKDILLSDEKSPFDVYINDLSKFIEYLRIEMSEGGNEKVSEARNAMLRIAEIMLKLSRKARKRWLKLYKVELEELIVKLTKGEMTIPVTGDINNKNRSFIVHMYTNHIAINACRIARNGNITVKFTFTGLKGEHIESPKLFNDSILKAMQYGLLLTDGSIYQGYPGMATHQMWQSIVWHLVFPGKNYIAIDGISINDNISTVWQLTSLNYKFEGKSAVNIKRGFVGEVVGFDDWLFLWFLLFAVFGDGNVDVQDEYDVREIRLFMGGGKYVLWRPIIERLSGLGFRGGGEYGWEWVVRVRSSRAVKLAREWLGDPVFGGVIIGGDLARLSDAVKLRQLIGLAGVGYRPKGRSSVIIGGVKMTVRVRDGYVELVAVHKDGAEITKVLESLKALGGINASVTPWGGGMSACV